MRSASVKTVVESFFKRTWRSRGVAATLLWPIATALQGIAGLRRELYRRGVLAVRQVNCMVIVVGNVVVGGAGKTPTAISIVQHLRSRQMKVGVVSRGYGRKSQECKEVFATDDPSDVGDEPLLFQRKTGVPVWVGQDRYVAAMALMAAHPDTQVIVCDDGMQHYGLWRDLEVCVFDNRGGGNGWTLPAGPLRQPWPRASVASAGQDNNQLLVLHTGATPAFAGFTAHRTLADHAICSDGSIVPFEQLTGLHAPSLMAVAGIAQPDMFFDMLISRGLTLASTRALPDHYDFDSYSNSTPKGYRLICTEKDALKIWKYMPNALAVPLVQTTESSFWQALDHRIQEHFASQLSFRHGHTTT